MPKVPDAYVNARKSEILGAAARCFARSGYRKTSMADIAAAAGLSVGALYRYFESKERLFQTLARSARETNAAVWVQAEVSKGPGAQLRSFVDRYFDMVSDPRCHLSLALDIRLRAEALDSEIVRHELRTAYRHQAGEIAKHFRAAATGKCGAEEAESRARALIGLLNEAGVQALLVPDFDPEAYRRTVLGLVETWTAENGTRE